MLWPRLSPRPSLGFPALRRKLLSPTEHSRDDVSRGVTEPALPSLVCEVPEVGMKEGLGGSGDSSRSHSVNQQGPSGWPSARGGHCGSHVQCSSTAVRPPLPQMSPPPPALRCRGTQGLPGSLKRRWNFTPALKLGVRR